MEYFFCCIWHFSTKYPLPQCKLCCLFVQLIRDEIQAGKTDKDIYKKLEDDFGETVLYAPKFDKQTAALWLSPVRQTNTSMHMLPSLVRVSLENDH